MARNTSITLGEHFDGFISSQVNTGRYGSVSEVIRAGLRLLEKTETKTEALRRMLEDGEQSGKAEYGFDAFIDELDAES